MVWQDNKICNSSSFISSLFYCLVIFRKRMTSTHKTYLQMHLDASSNLVLDLSEILSVVYSCEHIQNSNNFNCYDIHARSYLCKHYHYELKRLYIIRSLLLRKYNECRSQENFLRILLVYFYIILSHVEILLQ